MSNQPTPNPCVFCGGNGRKGKEHIIAQQHSERIGLRIGGDSSHWIATEPAVKRQKSRLLNIVYRGVCQECNSSWMNEMENDVQPFLVRMVFGDLVILDDSMQSALTAWCSKTLTVWLLHHARPIGIHAITPSMRRWIMERREPPPRSWVRIAHHAGPWSTFYRGYSQTAAHVPPDSGRVDGYIFGTTIRIGMLVCQLIGESGESRTLLAPETAQPPAVWTLWPRSDRPTHITWPGQFSLGVDSMDLFARQPDIGTTTDLGTWEGWERPPLD